MKDSEQLQGTIHFPVTSNHVKTSTGDTEKAQETDTDEPTEIEMECDSDTESPTDITTDVNFDTSVQVDDNEKDTDKDNGVNIDNLPGTKSGSEASTTVSHVVATIGSDDINTDIEAGASVGALDSNIESKEDRVNTNRQKRDLWTGAFVDFTQKSRKTSTETVKKSKDKVGACSTNSEKTKSQQNESKREELPTTVMIGGEMITIKVEKEDEDQYEQKEEPEDSESPSGDATPRQQHHFICKRCGKLFRSRAGLSTHERSHTGQAPYSCCGKSFFSITNLERHRCSLHNKAKKFKCDVCKFACGVKSDLTIHMKRVHTEPQFQCEICGKRFGSTTKRDEHTGSHSGEKRYLCKCGKPFRYSSGLSKHKKKCTFKTEF